MRRELLITHFARNLEHRLIPEQTSFNRIIHRAILHLQTLFPGFSLISISKITMQSKRKVFHTINLMFDDSVRLSPFAGRADHSH